MGKYMTEIKNIPTLPPREPSSHKGNYGRLLILAGSKGMVGAACLSTMAALRSGVGLVTLGIPNSLMPIASTKLTCAMVHGFSETKEQTFSMRAIDEILEFSQNMDIVAIGPGISRQHETKKMICALIPQLQCPIVLDADALIAISENVNILKRRKFESILTPHPGEFSSLLHQPWSSIEKQKRTFAAQFCLDYNCTIVLKCNPSIVTNGSWYYFNTTGNPGMATGGSGDVLTGIIAALLAQKLSSQDATILGTWIHGLAGDLASKKYGQISMIASDIIEMLPQAFKKIYSGE